MPLRCTFLCLDTVTLRVSARFHVSPVISLSRLRLRRPPHPPSFFVLSFSSSAPASFSFLLLLHLRFFLFHLQLLHLPPVKTTRRATILFPLPLPSYASSSDPARDQTTTTATNNHLVPLRCRERRCRCARRLIFGRTFRFGVLYWTVQKWHLPVSELTSCQVSVSFARAVPGRWRVYAFTCTYVRSHACCVCVYTCMRVAPQTRLFPHSTRGSIWPLSRARALDRCHTSVIAVRSLVECAYRAYVACAC